MDMDNCRDENVGTAPAGQHKDAPAPPLTLRAYLASNWSTCLCVGYVIVLLALQAQQTPMIDHLHPFYRHFDLHNYLAMAENPLSFFTIQRTHHAQRVFPSLLVSAIHYTFGFSIQDIFYWVTRFALAGALVLFYRVFRAHKVPAPLCLAVILFFLAHGQFKYLLHNAYQLPDCLIYPFSMGLIILTCRGSRHFLLVLSIFSLMTRQNLFFLAICCHLYLYMKTRDKTMIYYTVIVLTLFVCLCLFAGDGSTKNPELNLINPLLTGFDQWVLLLKLFIKSFYFTSPFLIILLLNFKVVYAYFLRYWWVAPFVLVAVVLPLLVNWDWEESNSKRLSFPGFWYFFLLCGFILSKTAKAKWTCWVYFALALLSWHKTEMPSDPAWLSIAWMNVWIGGVCLAEKLAGLRKQPSSSTPIVDRGH